MEPVTIWAPTNGLSEFNGGDQFYIDDPSDFYLVDTTGAYITDTGVTQTLIPATVWTEDNSV